MLLHQKCVTAVRSWIESLFWICGVCLCVVLPSPAAFVVRCCVVDLFAVISAEEISLRCGGGRGRFTFLSGL